jgi:hypothetical protein
VQCCESLAATCANALLLESCGAARRERPAHPKNSRTAGRPRAGRLDAASGIGADLADRTVTSIRGYIPQYLDDELSVKAAERRVTKYISHNGSVGEGRLPR